MRTACAVVNHLHCRPHCRETRRTLNLVAEYLVAFVDHVEALVTMIGFCIAANSTVRDSEPILVIGRADALNAVLRCGDAVSLRCVSNASLRCAWIVDPRCVLIVSRWTCYDVVTDCALHFFSIFVLHFSVTCDPHFSAIFDLHFSAICDPHFCAIFHLRCAVTCSRLCDNYFYSFSPNDFSLFRFSHYRPLIGLLVYRSVWICWTHAAVSHRIAAVALEVAAVAALAGLMIVLVTVIAVAVAVAMVAAEEVVVTLIYTFVVVLLASDSNPIWVDLDMVVHFPH